MRPVSSHIYNLIYVHRNHALLRNVHMYSTTRFKSTDIKEWKKKYRNCMQSTIPYVQRNDTTASLVHRPKHQSRSGMSTEFTPAYLPIGSSTWIRRRLGITTWDAYKIRAYWYIRLIVQLEMFSLTVKFNSSICKMVFYYADITAKIYYYIFFSQGSAECTFNTFPFRSFRKIPVYEHHRPYLKISTMNKSFSYPGENTIRRVFNIFAENS